jgi:hypothetical protein
MNHEIALKIVRFVETTPVVWARGCRLVHSGIKMLLQVFDQLLE